MSPLAPYNAAEHESEEALPQRRETILRRLQKKRTFDLLIVGGGIHGACVAHLAALNGLSTVLLERGDYACGTSSRSSKMAHGGLRYLEFFDLPQVLRGIRAREDLFEVAPHLVQPARFILPIKKGARLRRFMLGAGLSIYDLFARNPERRHIWRGGIGALSSVLPAADFDGHFEYCDGLMDDTRLVFERILAARQEGALCLNYAEVASLKQRPDSSVSVGWRDAIAGESHELCAGVVINCAGPWVPSVGRLSPGPLAERIVYSRGSHLFFDVPWNAPPLMLPLSGRSRYYWVWPHPAGTMVGTTERAVTDAPTDPLPSPDEIEEILERVRRDIPGAGLTRDRLHYCFAGIRTLACKTNHRAGEGTKLSRAHSWHLQDGVLSLIGGKFTDAALTAYEGVRRVLQLAGDGRNIVRLEGRKLPGAALTVADRERFLDAAVAHGVPNAIAERSLARFGGRALRFLEEEGAFATLGDGALVGDVSRALREEQVCTLEDLMRRRLGLEYLPGNGFDALEAVAALMRDRVPAEELERQKCAYRGRVEGIRRLMRGE